MKKILFSLIAAVLFFFPFLKANAQTEQVAPQQLDHKTIVWSFPASEACVQALGVTPILKATLDQPVFPRKLTTKNELTASFLAMAPGKMILKPIGPVKKDFIKPKEIALYPLMVVNENINGG